MAHGTVAELVDGRSFAALLSVYPEAISSTVIGPPILRGRW